ncbi:DUF3892 domain-containing protein [Patescibacteria group bacterium]|nr:DUF3892 domain-containing protein [Patescibacteria group bacterium]
MANCQITCITKPNVNSSHEHITHVGNPSVPWKLTVEQVIKNIDNGVDTFYVVDPRNGKTAYVGVQRPAGRRAYIQTYADGDWNNNLLSLNQCPL